MTDWTGFLRIRLKGSLYHGPTTRIPFFKFSAPLQRGRAKRGGEDDKKQASVSVFSEGLQSVDSHLAGRRFIFFSHQAVFTLPASSSIIIQSSV